MLTLKKYIILKCVLHFSAVTCCGWAVIQPAPSYVFVCAWWTLEISLFVWRNNWYLWLTVGNVTAFL